MYEQTILFGAPGTGKSYEVKRRLSNHSSDNIYRVTIHPEFLYTDFVGQLLPDTNPNATKAFTFVPGPFTNALVKAYQDTSVEVFLVLEELSRGNTAAIFGDIFQLLDRDEHFESRFPVRNHNIAAMIPTLPTDEIKLPSNFNILCTVNMNDQNVYPMDTAFKRRFEWEYISTAPAVDGNGNILQQLNNPRIAVATDNDRGHDIETTWQSFYTALNLFITDKTKGLGKNEDKQIGQFFIEFDQQTTNDSHANDVTNTAYKNAVEKIDRKIKNKLLLYLWQDVQSIGSFGTEASLFDKTINSYDDLYEKYGKDKIFSDAFINDFLTPHKDKYSYQ